MWADILGVGANLTVLGALVMSYRTWFRELQRDRDFWRTMALRGTDLAEALAERDGARDD